MTAISGSVPTPSRSVGYHRAVRVVSFWAGYYTRNLDPLLAGDRRDELASDLWEQGADADARRASGAATAASILWRAARGIPADLSWRRRMRSGDVDRAGWVVRWANSGSLGATWLLALATAAFGGLAITRIGVATFRHEFLPSAMTMTSLTLGMLALLCGLALLRRVRTRWIGALWLGASSLAVLHFGSVALITLSATAQSFTDPAHPDVFVGGRLLSIAVLAGIALFYLALSVAWIPPRRSSASLDQEVAL